MPWARSDEQAYEPFLIEPTGGIRHVVRLLRGKDITTGRILEINCGNGANSVFLARNGFEVHAIESKANEDLAKYLGSHGVLVHIQNPRDYLMFDDETFDIVIDLSNILTNADENEMMRILRKGGYLFLRSTAENKIEERRKI